MMVMSFSNLLDQYADFDFDGFWQSRTKAHVRRCLAKEKLTPIEFLTLLSPAAGEQLEAMAQKARRLTIQHFGRTIQLYIPLYISNHCNSECIYCGFNRRYPIKRRKLTMDEIDIEARAIAGTGMRHILVLTGEAPKLTPIEYLTASVKLLKRYFASIAIEMFPMETQAYMQLQKAGVDGLTIYQEVYDRETYQQVHLAGRKMDYQYRLDAPARGAEAGFRWVNIGALFGLAAPLKEAFWTGLHAHYLTNRYLNTEISISMPRINPAEGGYQPEYILNDRTFVQILNAFRLFLPRAGIPISTRERAAFRDHLMQLGATRLSAGSRTGVGGYTKMETSQCQQFEISDDRSVSEIVAAIRAGGLQPVYKDWELF
jgi:2-iminoacetate synthase